MPDRYPSRQVRRRSERLRCGGYGGNAPKQRDWESICKIANGIVPLIIAFIVASISMSGIIDVSGSYAMLFCAWIIGTGAITYYALWTNISAKKRLSSTTITWFILTAIPIGVGYYEKRKLFEDTHLVPDDKPTPESSCPIPEGVFVVFLGNNVSFSTAVPHTIIAMGTDIRGNPYPMLQVDRSDDGVRIRILRVFDDLGNIITRFDLDEPFWIDSNLRRKRPNSHTLIVYDDKDNEAIKLYLVNNRTLLVTGIFRRPGVKTLYVRDDGIYFDNNNPKPNVTRACVGYAQTDYYVGGPPLAGP
jgi:hypothetical protein